MASTLAWRSSEFGMSITLLDIELAQVDRLPNGTAFEWESVGGGEPMLWIEGGPGFPAHLGRPEAALFGEIFKVHLVNAPGCGRTSAPARRELYDLVGHVAFFEAVRQALGLGPLTLVGHSWGGLVATAYAALEPDAVRRLIVLDGYAGGGSVSAIDAEAERDRAFDRVREKPWFNDARAAIDATFALHRPSEREFVETFAPAWPLYFADPELPHNRQHIHRLQRELRYNVEVAQEWDESLEADDHRTLAKLVRCPTLILVGEHDFVCGPIWARVLADSIPGSHLAEIPDAGHMPQYEHPERVFALVQAWLRDVRSGAR